MDNYALFFPPSQLLALIKRETAGAHTGTHGQPGSCYGCNYSAHTPIAPLPCQNNDRGTSWQTCNWWALHPKMPCWRPGARRPRGTSGPSNFPLRFTKIARSPLISGPEIVDNQALFSPPSQLLATDKRVAAGARTGTTGQPRSCHSCTTRPTRQLYHPVVKNDRGIKLVYSHPVSPASHKVP